MGADDVDAVLFDLDGTICEYRRPGAEVLAHAFETVGVTSFCSISDYIEMINRREPSDTSFAAYREECFAEIAAQAGHDRSLGRAVARAYEAERDQSNVRFLPGASDALDRFAEQYPLGLVTNGGPDIQLQKLNALQITDLFDTIVYAGYDAPAKPDPAPFYRALEPMEVTPDRAVFVGNSLEADVKGSRAAGVASVWIENGTDPDPEPDYVVASPGELRDLPWVR